jgi:CMP-N-acetylneuraminic acid synthetase
MPREACLARQPTFAGRAGSFVIDEMEAQDIDTLTDWRLAELKMQLAASAP